MCRFSSTSFFVVNTIKTIYMLYIIYYVNRYGTTQAAALDISKAFHRVCHAGLLHKLNTYGISGQLFGCIWSFLRNRWL